MILRVFRIGIASVVLSCFFVSAYAQADQAGLFEYKRDDYGRLLNMVPGESGYYLLYVRKVKDNRDLNVVHLKDDMTLDWIYSIESVQLGGPSFQVGTQLAFKGNVYLFYSQEAGDLISERVVILSRDGKLVKESELFSRGGVNLVRKYVVDDAVYMVPVNYSKSSNPYLAVSGYDYDVAVEWKLLQPGVFTAFKYDMTSGSVTEKTISVAPETKGFYAPVQRDGKFYWQDGRDGVKVLNCVDMEQSTWKTLPNEELNLSTLLAGGFDWKSWHFQPGEVVHATFAQPSFDEMKNAEKGAPPMGKIRVDRYDGEKHGYELSFSKETIDKIALNGKELNLKKDYVLTGFETGWLFHTMEDKYVFICERSLTQSTNSGVEQYQCDLLMMGFNEKGEKTSEGVLDRKFRVVGKQEKLICRESGGRLRIFYAGQKPTTKGKRGAYQAIVNSDGSIQSERLLDVDNRVESEFYLIDPEVSTYDPRGYWLIHIAGPKNCFIYKIKS